MILIKPSSFLFVFFTAGLNVSSLISHPVHILDETGEVSPSAFIPFCSFGGNMSLLGRKVDGFQDPVCSAFTRKIVNNQLCYEVDLNRFRDQVDWQESLQSGLSLVIDTNDEYDVRKLLTENGNIKTEENKLDPYQNKQLQGKFSIFLKTISKSLFPLLC